MARGVKADDRRLKRIEVDQRFGIVPCTTWRWVKKGLLPPPHYINGRAYWWASEIERFEHEQMARGARRAS